MKTIADAISHAYLTWRGCKEDQCTKECPLYKNANAVGMCWREAIHYAGAAEEALIQEQARGALIETIPTDYTESSKQAMRKVGFTEDDPRN